VCFGFEEEHINWLLHIYLNEAYVMASGCIRAVGPELLCLLWKKTAIRMISDGVVNVVQSL
jgi:hypothetical protein